MDLLNLRRGQTVIVRSSVSQNDGMEFRSVVFRADTVSVSICLLKDCQTAVVAISTKNKALIKRITESGLRGQTVNLQFS